MSDTLTSFNNFPMPDDNLMQENSIRSHNKKIM